MKFSGEFFLKIPHPPAQACAAALHDSDDLPKPFKGNLLLLRGAPSPPSMPSLEGIEAQHPWIHHKRCSNRRLAAFFVLPSSKPVVAFCPFWATTTLPPPLRRLLRAFLEPPIQWVVPAPATDGMRFYANVTRSGRPLFQGDFRHGWTHILDGYPGTTRCYTILEHQCVRNLPLLIDFPHVSVTCSSQGLGPRPSA